MSSQNKCDQPGPKPDQDKDRGSVGANPEGRLEQPGGYEDKDSGSGSEVGSDDGVNGCSRDEETQKKTSHAAKQWKGDKPCRGLLSRTGIERLNRVRGHVQALVQFMDGERLWVPQGFFSKAA